jgi:branched-chain amino acid transport system permease protein
MTTIGQLVFSGLLIGSIYALMSMGLTLIFGVLRVVNFAHGEFLMFAMYGAWAFVHYFGFNAYIAILAVVPAMLLFGGLIHWLIIRPGLNKPHLVIVFATMGLSILMQNLALLVFSADLFDVPPLNEGSPIHIGPFYAKFELLIGFGVTLLATAVLQVVLKTTYLGKAIRATVQDGEAAELMGIPVSRMFSVFPTVGLNFVLIAFVVVVLGGMGSLEGALIGGMCIGVVQSLSGYYVAPAYAQMFFFILFLLVMVFRPAGLMGRKGEATLGMLD